MSGAGADRSTLAGLVLIALAIVVGTERIRSALLVGRIGPQNQDVGTSNTASVAAPPNGSASAADGAPAAQLVPGANPADLAPATALRAESSPTQAELDDKKLHVRDEAQRALAAQAATFLSACGTIRRTDPLEPAFSNYKVTVLFDGQGHETSRSYEPGSPHAARDACVRTLRAPPLTVSPAGEPIAVDLSLAVP